MDVNSHLKPLTFTNIDNAQSTVFLSLRNDQVYWNKKYSNSMTTAVDSIRLCYSAVVCDISKLVIVNGRFDWVT